MTHDQTKIIQLLIRNALNRANYQDRDSFKEALRKLLKEIEDSVNLYSANENINISTSDKESVITIEIENFISQAVKGFYNNTYKKGTFFDDTKFLKDDINPGVDSADDASDDPSGPNW